MPSMKNVIQKHNSKIMEDPKLTNNKTCSCRQKSDCPLNQNCLSECLVYNAVVNTSKTKNYYGTCEKSFKERYKHHTASFRNKSRQKSTELSNYIWELKENGENYTIDWIIAMKAHPYICGTRKCDLCLREKLLIARANSESLLLCEKSFKERYKHHTASFRNKSRQKSTELSNYIWELKENGENYTIDWVIAMKAHPYICGTRKCDLCLREKLLIARANSESLLNKRDELVSKCRHMNKFSLKCFKNR